MPKLIPVTLDDGKEIYIESTEDLDIPEGADAPGDDEEELLVTRGGMDTAINKFKSVEGAIRAYTTHTLTAFRDIAAANIDKVTLEFGIKVGGEAGIPHVTKGTVESN